MSKLTNDEKIEWNVIDRVCISIVSHRQGGLIKSLLSDLMLIDDAVAEVILTINVPEDESFYLDFQDLPLRVIRNDKPKGFGANHNTAFALSSAPFFAVLNPDIRLQDFNIGKLLSVAMRPEVGVVAPLVYSSEGLLEDSARCFPTLVVLLKRRLGRKLGPDYLVGASPMPVDWVAGMFMLFRSAVYRQVRGFDDRFFMYFEDVDLCRRLRLSGLQVVLCPYARVIHDAQRASRRSLRHFFWHCASTFRYLSKT